MEYESSDRSSVCGESYNGSLASADSTMDPDCKIASIRSVHGKRLTPAISQLEQWAEHNVVDLGGIWKARSAHCLASSSGCAPTVDELEKRHTKNQRSGFGTSNLSLNQQNDALPGTRFCAWQESGNDVLSGKPRSTIQEAFQCHSFATPTAAAAAAESKHLALTSPLPPAVKVLDTPVTVEACIDSSDANLYKIKHSLSIVAKGSSANSEPLVKPDHQARSLLASAVVERPHDVDTSCGNQMTKAEGKFKVPPPPPPLVKPLKLVPGPAADRAGTGTRGGKVRPAVPRRRSQLTDASIDQKMFNNMTVELGLSKTTSTGKSPVADVDGASNLQDFRTLAEAARLRFLNRKSGEFTSSAQGNTSTSVMNLNSGDQESHLKPVLVELGSVFGDAARLEKVTKLEKFNRESNSSEDLSLQEDSRSSLGVRCQLHNQHQVIADNLLPKASSLQGFLTEQKCLYENRNDKTLTNRASPDLSTTTGNFNTVSTDEGKFSASKLVKREAHGNEEIILPGNFSSLIPPPPLFISGDSSSKAVLNQSCSVTPVSFDAFDLASLAPPPPPGFEDPPLVADPALSETKKWSVDCPPQSDSAANVSHSLEGWSLDEVSAWLESIGMGEHAMNFKQNRVDGRRLALLGRNELISLGVTQVGQRMKIERAVKKATMIHRRSP